MIRSGFLAAVAALIVSIPLAAGSSNAELQVVFGPQVFVQPSQAQTGVTKTVNFSLDPPAEAPFLLSLSSVGRNTVILNGTQVYGPGKASPFSQYVDLSVSGNTLQVGLGGPGAQVSVTIVGYRYKLARQYANIPIAQVEGPDTVTGPPSSVNWVQKGAVTRVKNQGSCEGASWAFSVTGAIEGLTAITQGFLPDLSEQQLMDCGTPYGTPGNPCIDLPSSDWRAWEGVPWGQFGGFKYVLHDGIATEQAYPYTARWGTCKINGGAVKIQSLAHVPSGSVKSLQAAVAQQPVSVLLNGNWFSTYTGGVVDPCRHSHAVPVYASALVVGYVANKYWLLKNSLGASWGEGGYFQLAWGDPCGIADAALYPQ